MTLKEAASVLGVTPDTLRQQIANGSLRATKRGRDWWVTKGEVGRYHTQHQKRGLGTGTGKYSHFGIDCPYPDHYERCAK